jgi:hypothetical protein
LKKEEERGDEMNIELPEFTNGKLGRVKKEANGIAETLDES